MSVILKPLLLLCIVVMTTSCAENKNKKKSDNLVINVASVINATTANQKEFSFISKPLRCSDLSFRVGGHIDNFDIYVGAYYKKGEIIAEIDSRDFRIRKEQAEAKYKQAKAEFERIEVLYKKDNISASTFEKANAEYVFAKTTFETRVNELNDTKLIAPFNGYVGEVFIEKYQDAKATQPIISFVDINKLKIEFYVTQDIAFNSQNLKSVNVSFDAMPKTLYSAEMAETSMSATSNNLSYLFTAILPNPNKAFLAGMSGKVFFDVRTSDMSTTTIPQSALCHNPNDKNYVWIVDTDSNSVSKRGVNIGDVLANGNVSIVSGLEISEIVAISGLRFLSNGTVIEIAQK